MSLWVEV